jgi:membrane protein
MTRSPRAPKTPPWPAQRVGSWLAATAGAAWRRLRGRRAEPHPDLLTPEDYGAAEPGRGRAAAAPWLIPPRGWKDIAWRTWHEIGRARLAAQAGGVSFYLLLATFPAIAASVSLFGLFSNVATVEQQFLHFSTMFPSEAIDFLGDQMVRLAGQEHGTLGVAFVVSAALSIWSAKAGMQALFDGVNRAYNETEKRPYLKRALLTYAATLVAILFIVTTTSVALAVPDVLHAIGLHRIVLWWGPVRWLAILAAAMVAFTLVYRFGPSRRHARWRWVAAGGLFAAVAWMGGSFLFSWYLNSFTHLGVTYGSLGAMIGFMLWMWLSVLIVLIGAELNAEIEHQTACDTTIGEERPLGERGAVVADTVGGAFPMSPRAMRENLGAWLLGEIRGAFHDVRRALRLGR